MSTTSFDSSKVTRRALVASSLAGVVTLPTVSLGRAASAPLSTRELGRARRQEVAASPDGWRMWYLTSADELRPEAPEAPTAAEIEEVRQLQADATPESTTAATIWGTGPAVFPWSTLAGELFTEFKIGGMPQGRFMAHLHTAMHDAVIAAWDARLTHERPSPGATDDEIVPMPGVDPTQPSFPSEHAAVAGAASVVLAELLPDAEPGRFETLATEAAESRLIAGAAFRSDIEAGLSLGREIGARAVERGKGDGSDAIWDPSAMPTGPGYWQPTPPGMVETPAAPLAGSWLPWVMESGDQFRPAPPPAFGSPTWQAELKMVQELAVNRSFEQIQAATWWGAASPWVLFSGWVQELAGKDGLGSPHAARILADMYVAMADGVIAVWDAKYTWWTSRPITDDPALTTVIPTPPYPAFPSGYSAAMGSAATVVGHYFPEVADEMADRAWEAAASRAWAGIHYVIDDDIGLAMGRQVGRLVCALPATASGDDA